MKKFDEAYIAHVLEYADNFPMKQWAHEIRCANGGFKGGGFDPDMREAVKRWDRLQRQEAREERNKNNAPEV